MDDPFSFASLKTEAPGRYFHPLLGTLITGAARLMLAMTERLLTDRGLGMGVLRYGQHGDGQVRPDMSDALFPAAE